MPTRYMVNGEYLMHMHITLTTFTRFAQNSAVLSMLVLYGSTIYIYISLLENLCETYQDSCY